MNESAGARPTPEIFYTPRSFAVAQAAGLIAVECNTDVIHDLGEFVKQETGKGLPVPADQLDFTVYWNGGRRRSQWDTHYPDAVPEFTYFSSEQLPQLQDGLRVPTTKAQIAARGRHVIELSSLTAEESMASLLTRAITLPPAQDAKFDASAKAWGNQIREALSLKGARDSIGVSGMFSNVGNPKLEAEAAQRFSNAFVVSYLG
jgi:hypothetical protein